jgi:hypothetical protein
MPTILAGRLQPGWGQWIGAGFAGGDLPGQQQAGPQQQKRAEVPHRSPIFKQAVEESGVFIKTIVSPNPAVRKILTGIS